METIIVGLLALIVGAVVGSIGYQRIQAQQGSTKLQQAQQEIDRLFSDARNRIEKDEIEAKNRILQEQDESEQNLKRRRTELDKEDERLQKRRENLDERLERIEKREGNLSKTQSSIDRRRNEIDKMWEQSTAELERIAVMTQDEAKNELLAAVEADTRNEQTAPYSRY